MSNFNNNNQNNRNKNNTNTRSHQFYMDVDNRNTPTTLVMGYWNTMTTFKIHPALEVSQRNQSQMYNYDENISTAVTPEKTLALYNAIKRSVLPAIEEGKEKSVAITVGGGLTLVVVGVKKFEDTDNEMDAYLSIIKVGQDLIAKESLTYVFNSLSIIEDYEPTAGHYDIEHDPFSEFKLFIEFLKDSVSALSMGDAHAIRTVDRYYRTQIREALNIGQSGGGRGFGGARGNMFENNSRRQAKASPEQQLSNVDDINDMM